MFLLGEKAQAPFATVWQVEDKGNYVQGRISTSEKDSRKDGEYINSSWFVRFVGKAKEGAMNLKERDRIKILSGKVQNIMGGEGENKKSYLNVIVFDYEMLENVGYTQGNNTSKTQPEIIDDDDLPF